MRRNGRIWTTVSLLLLLSMLLSTAPVSAQDGIYLPFISDASSTTPTTDVGEPYPYVVLLEAEAALAHERALHAAAGAPAGKIDASSASVQVYQAELEASHTSMLSAAGVAQDKLLHNYTFAFNGFAALLTPSQARAIARQPGVVNVMKDQMRQADEESIPVEMGVSAEGEDFLATWRWGGYTGEDVVVGVIDTGIWPEHPSFADDGSYAPSPIGPILCEFGNTAHNPNDAPFTCNNKLLGARQMLATYRSLIGAEPYEYDSARDNEGHGTHTASTAAGNAGVPASIYGIYRGRISGVAPRARVVAYKGLGELGGFTSDLAAAIDQAVADGVDVINYSIGGGAGAPGADDIAFLFAANAGVYVATSAGNSGPGPATVGSPGVMPWITTVGANTKELFYRGDIYLDNGKRYSGASVTKSLNKKYLVDAEFAGGDLCVPGTLDAIAVKNKIVLCRRGDVGRAEKSYAVYLAGGKGMILYNNSNDDNLFTDTHWVPSVHIDNTPGLAIKAYIASTKNPKARIAGNRYSWLSYAPSMTIFSSRGPNGAPGAEDIIKPDITAPGIQIMAGYTPTPLEGEVPGELFAAIAGTSMSSPKVAGVFALLKEAHPDWSAAAAKSTLMTTASPYVRDNDRISRATPFGMGAGQVNVPGLFSLSYEAEEELQAEEAIQAEDADWKPWRKAFDPGLVYEAGLYEYAGFTCGADYGIFTPGSCAFLESIGVPMETYNLNVPSIGVASVAGSQTVTRTVTSVAAGGFARKYTATVHAPKGYQVSVNPKHITLKPGQSASYQVTVTNINAPADEWRFGSITWRDNGRRYRVHSPIAVKAQHFDAPEIITGSGESGSANFDVKFGYDGSYTAAGHGLEPALITSDTVAQDPDQEFDPGDDYSNAHPFTLSGAALLRIAIPKEATEADADLDVFVYDPAGNLVASSTSPGTNELVDILLPADGTWTVYVHGWSAPGGDSDYDMYSWVISATPGGNLIIDSAPTSAAMGVTESVNVSWTGATAGQWHLGAVSHTGDSGLMGLTLVEVDNR